MRMKFTAMLALLTLSVPQFAHAQWAVIDVAAVTRLTTEIQTLDQTLTTAEENLAEARAQLSSMSGDRGMENLLANIRRNYLPPDWAQLSAALNGANSNYAALVATVRAAVAEDTVLTPSQYAALSGAGRAQIATDRTTAAMLQAVSREALADSSGRFGSLQTLISTIGSASDQKSVLDLTARISAEQTMLENEQTKLRVLFAAAQAERWADRERARERAIARQGDFSTRFQPTP